MAGENPKLNFPSESISQKKKLEPSYGLEWAKAIESNISSKNNEYFKEHQERVRLLRSYAQGNQDVNQYKTKFDPEGNPQYVQMDWSIMPVVPSFVKTIVSDILNQTFRINVEAQDPIAMSKRDAEKKKMVGRMINSELIESVKKQTGYDLSEGQIIPEDMEEVEIHMDINFKQSVEVAMSEAIRITMNKFNDYEDDIKPRLVEDLVTLAMAATKVYFDRNEGIKIRYVDIENFFTSESFSPNYEEIKWACEIVQMTISDIKRLDGYKTLKEEDYKRIAKQYAGKNNNPTSFSEDFTYNHNTNSREYQYDEFRVSVMDFETKLLDDDVYVYHTDKHNNKHLSKPTPNQDEKYWKGELKDYETVCWENVYGGKYILESGNMIFGWALQHNQVRPKENIQKTTLSYKVYATSLHKMRSKSLVENLMPLADAYQEAWLKRQQYIAQTPPDGLIWDLSTMEDMMVDNKKWTILQLQDFTRQTGDVFTRTKSLDDGSYNQDPVRPRTSPMSQVGVMTELMLTYLNQMRDVSGITPEMQGNTKRDQLVGVTQISIDTSRNSNKYLNRALQSITKRSASDVGLRVQDLKKDTKFYKVYKESIGLADMLVIDAMDDLPMHNFGISVEIDAGNEDKVSLYEGVQLSISNKEISWEDGEMAKEIYRTNGKASAFNYMKVMRKRRAKMALEEERAKAEYKAQFDQQSAMVAAQNKERQMQLEIQKEVAKAQSKGEQDRMTLEFEYNMKSGLSLQEYEQNYNIEGLKAGVQMNKEELKETRKDERQSDQIVQGSRAKVQVDKVKEGSQQDINEDAIKENDLTQILG